MLTKKKEIKEINSVIVLECNLYCKEIFIVLECNLYCKEIFREQRFIIEKINVANTTGKTSCRRK